MGNDFMIGSNALYMTLGNNSSTKKLTKLWNHMKFLNKHPTLLSSLKEPLSRISVKIPDYRTLLPLDAGKLDSALHSYL